jgi:hypothetical protein
MEARAETGQKSSDAEMKTDLDEEMETTVEISQKELKVMYLEANPEVVVTVVERQEVHNEINMDTIGALDD